MTNHHTTAEAAHDLGCSVRTVRRLCQQHKIGERFGSALALTAADIARLKTLVRPGPGNPDFGTATAAQRGVRARRKRR